MDLQHLVAVHFHRGEVITFTGPMRAEKTTHLINLAKKIGKYSPYRAVIATNHLNTRDTDKEGNPVILSAGGERSELVPLIIDHKNPEELLEKLAEENNRDTPDNYGKTGPVDVLFIEECNFFDSKFPEVIERIKLEYPELMIVLLGLNYNFKKETFGIMGWANSNFTKYELKANCNILKGNYHACGMLTEYTARLVNPDKVEGYDGEKVSVIDKFGKKIKDTFTFDPIFSPTVLPEEKDTEDNEKQKTRLYTVACSKHHKLPYKKEALEIESFIKNQLISRESLPVEIVLEKFEKIKYHDQILRYLTEEKGIKYDNGVLILRNYVSGTAHGNYLPHPSENLKEGIYKPELRNLLLSEAEKELLKKLGWT
ncbi:hypothetical protein HY837_02905 [archaeon]|nr:hypothetical protein [archaeon]